MLAERTDELKHYIVRHLRHMDLYMRPLFDPKDKNILVIGSGWGVETYWCLVNGARRVVGVDPAPRSTAPLDIALREFSPDALARFEHHQGVISDLPAGSFDAIVSNNVFEHIFDLVGTLTACRRFMPAPGNRLHIFTDPLYYSSAGAHLPIEPWAHLNQSEDELRNSLPPGANWNQYKTGLNGMTLTSFLGAVRESGMWIEKLGIIPDRNRASFSTKMQAADVAPMDALLEGISCTLAFPENI